ncbi:MAG: T9SS type A sorting domain-containing protein, partial [Ferruginibacter sp.]
LGGNFPAAQWTTAPSPYVPTATPVWRPAISSGFAGNYFAYITSDVDNCDINNALTLTNSVSTVGYTSLFMDVDMFFDHYLPDGNTSIVDVLYVEISSNGGAAWTLIENNSADVGIGTKFLSRTYNLSVPAYLNNSQIKIRFRFRAIWTNGASIDNVRLYGSKPLAPSFSWSPTTGNNLFLDAAGSSPYTGGSVPNVYVKPTSAQLLAGTDLNFTATASLSNGCSASAPVVVKIGPSTWLGSVDNQWHNPNNWCSKTIPSATTIVEIPSPSTNMPVITTNAIAKNILVKSGATLTISPGASLSVNGIFNNSGTLANNGRITLNGTAPQTFPGTGIVSSMSEVEIANSAGVTLNKTFILSTQLLPTLGTLNLANYDITLLSNASKTASVGAIGVNADIAYGGGGRFVVQRYIATGAHGKGWQLLSSPLKEGLTIFNAWQNGGVNAVGKGTLIHHNLYNGTNGFDVGVAVAPSIKSYNYVSNDWTIYPSNTNSTYLDNPHGYLLFVRGDRTVSFPANPTSPTVLSNRGKIYTRTSGFTPASVAVNATKFESVGNPYASQIDFTKLTFTGGVDNTKFYVWDPLLLGEYQVGGYQVIGSSSAWKPVPGSAYYPAGTVKKTIESGQAFLVVATATNGTVAFTEAAKSVGSNLVNRPEDYSQLQILRSNLMTNNFEIADGNAVSFNQNFSNAIDENDASKIMNSGENFGIIRNSKILAIEARSLVLNNDTVFYYLKKPALNKVYNLVFEPDNMDASLNAELIDNFLKTRTIVSMTEVTTLPVTFSNDANSYKVDRFMLVFNRGIAGPLPVTFVSISAVKNNKEVEVKWKVENEINLENYIVERSVDGRNFVEIGNVLPSNINEYKKVDFEPFASENYYRIKAITIGGMAQYSAIVKVAANEMISSISVYPNPLVNTSVNIQFLNQQKGKYSLKIINNLGQVIYRTDEDITGSNVIRNIELSKAAGAGIYNLIIRKPDGGSEIIQMIKK